jgi:hypothetical protein
VPHSFSYVWRYGVQRLLTVYFGTPNMFITLRFRFDYGTNPPLGTLICSEHDPICHLFELILVIHANTSNETNHIV